MALATRSMSAFPRLLGVQLTAFKANSPKRQSHQRTLAGFRVTWEKAWNILSRSSLKVLYEASARPPFFTQKLLLSSGSHPWTPTKHYCNRTAATPMPGHVPYWSKSWPSHSFPDLYSNLPCSYRLAWKSLYCDQPYCLLQTDSGLADSSSWLDLGFAIDLSSDLNCWLNEVTVTELWLLHLA